MVHIDFADLTAYVSQSDWSREQVEGVIGGPANKGTVTDWARAQGALDTDALKIALTDAMDKAAMADDMHGGTDG